MAASTQSSKRRRPVAVAKVPAKPPRKTAARPAPARPAAARKSAPPAVAVRKAPNGPVKAPAKGVVAKGVVAKGVVAKRAAAQRAAGTRPGTKRPAAKRPAAKRPAAAAPARAVKVKWLDPVARCGAGTSVEELYRVDEQLDGRPAGVHLVFFDHHGWYCVHGRGCGAVADVHRELRAQGRSVPRLATTTRAAGR